MRAGPWGTRILSTLGAEVIKVEWPAPGSVHHNDRYTNTGKPERLGRRSARRLSFSPRGGGVDD